MKNLNIILLIAIALLFSCKKAKESEPNCNTVFYSYVESANIFDTIAIAQSDANFSIDSLVAKFQISVHGTGTIDSGCVVTLINQSLGNIVHVYWDFGDGSNSDSNNPVHTFFGEGIHKIKLFVFNQNNMVDTAMFSFNYTLSPKLFFPNIFSPNNDAVNDLFRPIGIHIDTNSNNYSLTVMDKDNSVLFETHNFHESFSASNIDFSKYQDGEVFYAEFSAKTTTGNNISGCTPLIMRLLSFSCGDANLVFPDQIDERYGNIYVTNETLCH